MLSHIKDKILAHKVGDTELTGEVKLKIVNDLNSHYNDSTIHFFQICMFLDPRFKLSYVPNQDTKATLKCLVTDEIITNSLGTMSTASVPVRGTNSDQMPPKKAYNTL